LFSACGSNSKPQEEEEIWWPDFLRETYSQVFRLNDPRDIAIIKQVEDFSPKSQDKGAIVLMTVHKVFDIATRGDFSLFQRKASNLWTSFSVAAWQGKKLEERFIKYRGQELSGISMIATPIGKLIEV